jgi:hypothetical protein
MKIYENIFPPNADLQILDILITSHITLHTTHGNELCLKLLLGVCNTLSTSLVSKKIYKSIASGAVAKRHQLTLKDANTNQ